MSRSRKKTPIATDKVVKGAKKVANRRVRKLGSDELGNGNNYKKHFNSWDIHDYKEFLIGKVEEWWKKIGK